MKQQQGGGGSGLLGVRFESQRFRLLSIVVGCFLISVTFLLSSRPDAGAFDTLSPKPWLEEARSTQTTPTTAIKTVKTSPKLGGRDFLVDVVPQRGAQGESHGRQPQQSAGERTETEWVKDTVIIEERIGGAGAGGTERAEQEEVESGLNAAAGADRQPGVQDEAAQGTATEEEEAAHHDDLPAQTMGAAVTTARPAVLKTTAATQPDQLPVPGLFSDKETQKVGGRTMKLQADPQQTPAIIKHTTPLPPLCDFSDRRADICDFSGDIRLDANTSSYIVVVDPAVPGQSHKVRPYQRKGDETCMGRITEIIVRTSSALPPKCTQTHTVPAVTFSIGGYTGNIFHDFSDVLVPLYNTIHKYGGEVQLVMTNVAPWWLVKYDKMLRTISRYAPIDLAKAATAGEVHCFPHAIVSLRAHRELIIERDRSVDGLATPDFTRFVRRALSLPRDAPSRVADGTGRKPRLLIIARHRTRILLNLADVILAAEGAGFEAAMSESDVGDPLSRVGAEINSADVLVGVHGAGLTNMMFLPPGATLVQVVPWGGLQWIAHMDYGDPAEAMGLRYIQYEIGVEESSLKDKYPRDHEIFTNPTGMHKKGFGFMRQTLMDGQNITVDLDRFRGVLQEALGNYLAQ